MAHSIHFVVGFGVLLHVLFWGAGGAMLAMPRPWRRFWPVLIVPVGLVLQSAVVWVGAQLGLRGTNSYAWASEAVPAGLLVVGLWRCGMRAAWIDVSRFGLVWLAMAASLVLLIVPLAIASRGLTTISLGSCDAGDYAGGARVLMEFARGDREGFLGLTEVVRVQSADNFFEYWTRLNHFTPAALIALNGTILDCAPHELTSLLTMVLLAGSLPVVFWVARAVVGYSGAPSVAIAAVYGVSPITWYAVAHVSPAPLLAAQAIALLTWAGVALWRGRLTLRRSAQFAAVLAAGYGLVLGSYNFILIVALVPAAAFAGGAALWRRFDRLTAGGESARLGRWAVAMAVPLVAAGIFFFERVAGLAERFTLLRAYDFGWKIPALSPEGWLGMVSGPRLEAWNFFGLRWVLAAVVSVALGWALVRGIRQRRRAVWVVASLTWPVLAGYVFLVGRGASLDTNASYDAYKLFAVFYPLLLPALCWWVTLRRSARLTEWFGVVGLGGVVMAFNVAGVAMFGWRMAQPPLIVDGELRQLRKIEAMPEVKSVNVLLPHMWERLWANAFLLRKPQYFLTDTYEARWHTALKGEWDLRGGLIAVRSREANANIAVSQNYSLARHAPNALTVEFGDGWHDEEREPKTGERWRWSKRRAVLRFNNPQDGAVYVVCTFDWRVLGGELVELEVPGPKDGTLAADVGERRGKKMMMPLSIPPGRSEVVLSMAPGGSRAAGDARELGVCLFGLDVAVGVGVRW